MSHLKAPPAGLVSLFTWALTCACLAAVSGPASAQPAPQARAVNNGVAASPPPTVVVREADGTITVRATRINEPIVIDGHLDENVYSQIPSISDFIQQEPNEGQPTTERTDAWLFFDD